MTQGDANFRACIPVMPQSQTRKEDLQVLPIPIRRGPEAQGTLSGTLRDMERFFRWPWFDLNLEGGVTSAYPVDIYEEDDHIVVDAEMPGFKREDIQIALERGVLSISAERKSEETKAKRHLSERRFTRVDRSFTLPTDVDPSQVEAKLEDGVLHVMLPKTAESKQQKIEVN
jgi:HSP20 family protein